jgi:hypothetical protein
MGLRLLPCESTHRGEPNERGTRDITSDEWKVQMSTSCWECEKQSEHITSVTVPIAADRVIQVQVCSTCYKQSYLSLTPPSIPRSEYSA